ncbi:MAG: exodeoxyribonuclease VII large subunit [Clostridia bacterium]|nr:exodeoxyribonuclease VII large subunit [Clostridia bacterium]
MLDSDRFLGAATVRGEISNFVHHRSGHFYFSLKDSEGQIRAVMFRSAASSLRFMPENGMKVTVFGTVSVYTRDGTYQLYASSIQPDGIGALYLAYEQLKEKLSKEGLFDEIYKRPLPKYPSCVGVITSPTGAAVRDIINVIGRRYPLADIYLMPALVQGASAEDSLIAALDTLTSSGLADVIIIGRGGGSIEDLWAFNGERLARRIFASDIPIISAVGHETDFTICDFVADLRAPTPSAAAELAVPDYRELSIRLDGTFDRCRSALVGRVERSRSRLLDARARVMGKTPELLLSQRTGELKEKKEALLRAFGEKMNGRKNSLAAVAGRLEALSPLAVLSRGYAVVENERGLVRRADDLSLGDRITVRLSDGKIDATVERKQ